MALIKCEECGKEISDKAKACVYCGCPILKNDCNESKEFAIKQSTNEIFDKNSRKLSVEFNAVVSNKSKERSSRKIFKGTDGKPAPDPTSQPFALKGIKLSPAKESRKCL